MSERAAVIHITLKAIAKIEDLTTESGAQVQIIDNPTYKTDFTLIAAAGSDALTKEQTDKLTAMMEYVVAQMFAKAVKVPDDVEQINNLQDVMKGAVN